MAFFFNFILAHQGDSADPELLHWIKERLDGIFGPEPWVIVAIMGFAVLAIPVSVGFFYLLQANRRASAEPRVDRDRLDREKAP
ncbi:MAG: hypothetical protein VYB63_08745 [Chloroflexota bacterium]|nr:hypothetical protein [Dehalococcoidia bacterium]MEC9272993.1 hypothetical protein [Chloroflexota bacterium]